MVVAVAICGLEGDRLIRRNAYKMSKPVLADALNKSEMPLSPRHILCVRLKKHRISRLLCEPPPLV